MKYIVIWVFLNINTGHYSDAFPELPIKMMAAEDCAKAISDKGPQTPDKDGNIKLYTCFSPK